MVKLALATALLAIAPSAAAAPCQFQGLKSSGSVGAIVDAGEQEPACCAAGNSVMTFIAFTMPMPYKNMVTNCPSAAMGGCVSASDPGNGMHMALGAAPGGNPALNSTHYGKLPTDAANGAAWAKFCQNNLECMGSYVAGASADPTKADLNMVVLGYWGKIRNSFSVHFAFRDNKGF
jgi:hypothetical protein